MRFVYEQPLGIAGGAVGLFVFLFAFIFMALAQLRHAIWNRGDFFNPQTNNLVSYIMIAVAIILAAGLTMGGIAGIEVMS